jgi:hypothetical protein
MYLILNFWLFVVVLRGSGVVIESDAFDGSNARVVLLSGDAAQIDCRCRHGNTFSYLSTAFQKVSDFSSLFSCGFSQSECVSRVCLAVRTASPQQAISFTQATQRLMSNRAQV